MTRVVAVGRGWGLRSCYNEGGAGGREGGREGCRRRGGEDGLEYAAGGLGD